MANDVSLTEGIGPKKTRTNEKTTNIHTPVVDAGAHVRTYKGVQTLVLTGTAQSLTVPGGATFADIYAEGATANDFARYWHGATPTSSAGKKLGDGFELASAAPGEFEAINGSGTITLRIEYYAYE